MCSIINLNYLLSAAKECDLSEIGDSFKTNHLSKLLFEQLTDLREWYAHSQQELKEIQSLPKCLDFIPDKVEQVFNNQHSWSLENLKCDDKPLFDGDNFAELKLWYDKQQESQETPVSVSDPS
jgi:hypothetical protein